ncbi:MAG TPA: hypothetical protein VFV08_11120 [Puia sp.]|nr:hypothetical protein [Puia sp.]
MKILLTILNLFVALTAIVGGLMMVYDPSGNNLGLPLSLLEKTPFHSFLIPGIILATAIGGINLLAFIYRIGQQSAAIDWSLAGGISLICWILGQVWMLGWNWMAFAYLFIGISILLISWQIKGKWMA